MEYRGTAFGLLVGVTAAVVLAALGVASLAGVGIGAGVGVVAGAIVDFVISHQPHHRHP
jgi:hypothetical protein